MSRKPLVAIILLLISIMVFGATSSGAWFSGQEIRAGKTATPEKVDILINTSGIVPVRLSDMEPGTWYGPYRVNIYNPDGFGTMPVKYRIFDRLQTAIAANMFERTDVKVEHFECNGGLYSSWEGKLSDLYWESPAMSIQNGILDVDVTHCFEFNFKLDDSTADVIQENGLAFDLIFDAAQVNDPGW